MDFDRYEPESGDGRLRLTEGSNAYAILRLLASNPEQAFTPKEIAEETQLPRGSVGVTLTRLESRELVRHKEPDWAIGLDDRLAAYASMLHGLDAADDRLGDGDWGDWRETAVDPRARRTEGG